MRLQMKPHSCKCCLSFSFILRMVPPFVTVHTFCASRNILRTSNFLWKMSTYSKMFLRSLWLFGKAGLSKGFWNPWRKSGVTMHFFQDNKKWKINATHVMHSILIFFLWIIVAYNNLILSQNCMVTLFSFCFPTALTMVLDCELSLLLENPWERMLKPERSRYSKDESRTWGSTQFVLWMSCVLPHRFSTKRETAHCLLWSSFPV